MSGQQAEERRRVRVRVRAVPEGEAVPSSAEIAEGVRGSVPIGWRLTHAFAANGLVHVAVEGPVPCRCGHPHCLGTITGEGFVHDRTIPLVAEGLRGMVLQSGAHGGEA